MPSQSLQTERLTLGRWQDADVAALARMNQDPAVMEFLGAPMSVEATEMMVRRLEQEWADKGYGLFAVRLRADSSSIGFIGLHEPTFEAPFTPCVEIGWRLAAHTWGKGLATEGARAVRAWAHGDLGLAEIVSMTALINVRSQRVMEKVGLTHDPADDFEHPRLAAGDPLRPHVLYRGRAL